MKFSFFIAFVLVNLFYLNNPLLANYQGLIEPMLMALLTVFLLVAIIKYRGAYILTGFELFSLAFVLYSQLNTVFTGHFNIIGCTRAVFIIVLYFGLKLFLLSPKTTTTNQFLMWAPLASILTCLVTLLLQDIRLPETINNLFSPNKSIFAILLASQLLFTIPVYWAYKKNSTPAIGTFLKIVIPILLTLAILLLIKTEGRAGWMGFAAGGIYILYRGIENIKAKKLRLIAAIICTCILFPILLMHKSDSSKGRLLIYKVSASMLKDNWLWGIGDNQFKIKYNQYQAAYFSTADINSKEALLADNSFYAFNDPLQTFIENGIIGFFICALALYFLVRKIIAAHANNKNNYLLTAATASFIGVFIASLFSYPLQIFPVLIQLVICMALINGLAVSETVFPVPNHYKLNWLKPCLVTVCLFTLVGSIASIYCKTRAENAMELSKSGFKKQSLEIYESIKKSYFINDNTLYLYANELYYNNQLPEAKIVIEKAKTYYCSNEVYRLSAKIASELKNDKEAENDFKTTLYMVPNRMTSRFDLFNYYLQRKDTAQAVCWGNSILKMPVKVSSNITSNMQKNTARILKELK